MNCVCACARVCVRDRALQLYTLIWLSSCTSGDGQTQSFKADFLTLTYLVIYYQSWWTKIFRVKILNPLCVALKEKLPESLAHLWCHIHVLFRVTHNRWWMGRMHRTWFVLSVVTGLVASRAREVFPQLIQ